MTTAIQAGRAAAGRAPRVRRAPRRRAREGDARRIGRRQRWGAAGVLYVVTCVFLALGAVNAQNNLLFLAFGLGLGGLLTSGLVSGASLMGLRVRRRPVGECAAGTPSLLRYEVASASSIMPAFCVILEERTRSLRKGETRPAPTHKVSPVLVGHVGPRRSAAIETSWLPLRRGWVELDELSLATTFPFGLMRKTVMFSAPARVLVWPARVPARAAILEQAARGARQTRLSRRASVGGEDVFGVREFREGDAIKDIAWRATARGHAVLVRDRAELAGSRLWIALNIEPAPAHDALKDSPWNEPELAIACAAELAIGALGRGLGVGLCVTQSGVMIAPREGLAQRAAILDALGVLDSAASGSASLPRPFRRDEAMIEVHIGGPSPGGLPASRVRLDVRDLDAWCADPASIPAVLRKAPA